MKISNSKKELARIISENGEWREGEFAAQDGDGLVGGYGSKPKWNSLAKHWWCEALGGWFSANKIKNHHQTVLSRTEYFHLYPAPDADGWIEWNGKPKSPVENGVLVDVKLKGGGYHEAELLDDASWSDAWGNESIIAYRLHKQQSKPEFCESVMRSIPDPDEQVWANPPSIEQLAADYRNAKDHADRKREEADDAKADADAKLKALELAGEGVGLIVTPIAAKKEPELVITDWRDLRVGDEVECVESNIQREKYNGMVGRLHIIDESDTSTPYLVDFGVEAKIWCNVVKFIRRP